MSKIINKNNLVTVPLSKMEEGDIAVVIKWHNNKLKKGDLVQKLSKFTVIALGKLVNYGCSSSCDFLNYDSLVAILSKGDQIVIEV